MDYVCGIDCIVWRKTANFQPVWEMLGQHMGWSLLNSDWGLSGIQEPLNSSTGQKYMQTLRHGPWRKSSLGSCLSLELYSLSSLLMSTRILGLKNTQRGKGRFRWFWGVKWSFCYRWCKTSWILHPVIICGWLGVHTSILRVLHWLIFHTVLDNFPRIEVSEEDWRSMLNFLICLHVKAQRKKPTVDLDT